MTYPRWCKGKHGPHLIEGPGDETKVPSKTTPRTCARCREAARREWDARREGTARRMVSRTRTSSRRTEAAIAALKGDA